jgi:hypothetical protein
VRYLHTLQALVSTIKQDGAHQCLKRVHTHEARYSVVCEHKKHSDIIAQRRCFGFHVHPAGLQLSERRETGRVWV